MVFASKFCVFPSIDFTLSIMAVLSVEVVLD